MNTRNAKARAFCAALASICEGRVRVVCDGQACTDGSTIHLPASHQIKTPDGDIVVCGIACHEASHVYFGTPQYHRAFVEKHSSDRQHLAADCYNAVADIADESRFERCFPKARDYFEVTTNHAAAMRVTFPSGDITRPQMAIKTSHDVLVISMLYARRKLISDCSAAWAVKNARNMGKAVKASAEVLRKALSRSRNGRRSRQRREWERLDSLAESLMDIIERFNIRVLSASLQNFPRWVR